MNYHSINKDYTNTYPGASNEYNVQQIKINTDIPDFEKYNIIGETRPTTGMNKTRISTLQD